MSTNEMLDRVTFQSGANLNGQLYRVVQMDNTGRVVLAVAATDVVVGVVAHDPQRSQFDTASTLGDDVPVGLLRGFVPMVSGGVIAAGDFVVAGAAGAVVSIGADPAAAVAASWVLGQARTAGVANQVVSVFAQPFFSAA